MSKTPNLELASSRGFLWPPIADALDTYLRRRNAGADAFERVWRLIHVWEATAITVATAALSRLASDASTHELFKRCREFFYGQSWNQVNRSFATSQGAHEGSIDQWINILEAVAKDDALSGSFLPSVGRLLSAPAIPLRELAVAWSRACDAPSELLTSSDDCVRVGSAMRHINSLRNRFAHVPFPHDRLADLADALEAATDALFSTAPSPASHEKEGLSSALTGALRIGRCFLRGSAAPEWISEPGPPDPYFVVPAVMKAEPSEAWPAAGFIFLDSMMRPHLLTRLKGFDVSEYTRFRAEANAVVVRPESGLAARIPRPTQPEYDTEEEEHEEAAVQSSESPATATIAAAVEEIRREKYDAAIALLEEISRLRPQYHVAWLRLGHARREKAVRNAASDPESSIRLLLDAADAIEVATNHRDPAYQAVAHYELSKVYYHLARFSADSGTYTRRAHEEGVAARGLSPDIKYQTWCEYLERWLPLSDTQTSGLTAARPQAQGEGAAPNGGGEA